MSELSEVEKRRILRERRQQKFNNGGATSRLNKITGQVPDSQLDNTSPLDARSTSGAAATSVSGTPTPPISKGSAIGNEASTLEMDELIASISKPASSAVPPKEPRSPVAAAPEKSTGASEMNDPQFDLLKNLMNAQQPQDGSTPDLLSMLGSMNGEGADDLPNPFASEPVDRKMLDYHNYAVNSLKSWSILFKWLILFPYIYLITKSSTEISLPVPHWMIEPSNFFSVFIAFEIVATSVYYRRLQSIEKNNKVNTLQNSSKIAKLVSFIPVQGLPIPNLRGKILMALQYWDVLSMLLTDICFVLIAMGICSYL